MHTHVLIAVLVLLATATVTQSRRWLAREVGCWITQKKVPATWEDAQRRCETHGAILASPLNTKLFNYMQTLINVHNHSAAYFIGTRANRSDDGQEVQYVSVEGNLLDDMPDVVFEAIEQLDIEQGDCLSMDRRGIHAVSCWDHLPYICYSNDTMECGSEPTASTPTPGTSSSASPPSSTTLPPSSTAPPPSSTTPPPSSMTLPPSSTVPPPSSTTPPPSSTTPPPSSTTPPPSSTSPSPGYTYKAATGSWYKYNKNEQVTWNEAQATCKREGGHLVVVNDSVEAETVRDIQRDGGYLLYTYVWIDLRENRPGLNDWQTASGQPQSYVYHEWSGSRAAGFNLWSCAVLNQDKLLYNWNCEFKANFICESSQYLGS